MDNGNSTTYELKGLAPYSWHVFRVRAKADGVTSDWSDALSQPTLLAVPANIRTNADSSQIVVTWDEVSGAAGYDIEVDGAVQDNGAATSYTLKNLKPNTAHTFRIRAKNDNVKSIWSDPATQLTAPAVPGNVHATATTSSITVAWDAVDGADSYSIEMDGKVLDSVQGAAYTIDSLQPNTMHILGVRANNAGGSSDWSADLKQRTNPVMKVDVGKDTVFNFVVVAPAKPGVSSRQITVNYNPDELDVLDLSAVTPDAELQAGPIAGTNITVDSFEPGKIVYSISHAESTVVNSIKFKAKTNEYSKIIYTVK